MRSRLLSLNQVVESEAARLGLSKWEVVNVLESSIERKYLEQRRHVHIRINIESQDEPLLALEARETPSGLIWLPLEDIRPPHPDVLQRDMESYVKQKDAERNWWLVHCQVVSVEMDHYLVEVREASEPGLVSRTAVLPLSRLSAKNQNLQRGQWLWCVMTEKSRARYDGAAHWTMVETEFMATRTDSIFLKMLVKKYWHLPVETDISNNAGLIMLPQDKNLGSIIGPNGKYVNDLKEICGLSRIVVARRSERRRPDMRLISAVKQIVGLRSVQVRPPLAGADEWRLKVSTREAPVLVGSGGTNLRFISVLTGLRIKLFVRDGS